METMTLIKGLNAPDCRLSWLADHDAMAGAVYERALRPSLLQHPAYGAAYGARAYHIDRRAVVLINGETAGMVQIFEARLGGGVFHSVALDHGPVWLPGYGDASHNRAFFENFARLYPARAGRRRRLIPALPDTEDTRALLAGCGFRHQAGSSYQTIWHDLSKDITPRRNWIAMVQRAQDSGLRIEWDDTGRTLGWLLRYEAQARRQKSYHGPSYTLMQGLARRFNPVNGLLVGRALMAGRPVAGLLFILHAPSATYQIGWTGPDGRRAGAQNLLLWDGLRILKQRGIGYLDMGGVNDGPAKSVKYFKEGMGGELVTQPGIYR
jgi:hypothetical protein